MTHGRVLLSRKAGAGEPAVIGQRGGGEQGLESVGGSRNTGSVSNESLNFVLESVPCVPRSEGILGRSEDCGLAAGLRLLVFQLLA